MGAVVYFAIWAVFFFLMMRLGCGAHVAGHGQNTNQTLDRGGSAGDLRWTAPETDKDPVCGKTVHTNQAKPSVYAGMVYYFCSRDCREQFEAAPHLYVNAGVSPHEEQLEHVHG